ncbi:unnamed protein product [Brassicogethes aeneus]|uniref:Uncharacterized protein n=1 Tax=Brassicogethes aeneus TaxID=1431903 RepID=A0A9P0AQ17_BRAAE|nr:unnamed protein product [Brassicogethes aeneus]
MGNENKVIKNADDEISEIAAEKEAVGGNLIQNIDEIPIIIQLSTAEEYIVVGSELHQVSESVAPNEIKYQVNDYVVVHYNKQYFPGVVTEIIGSQVNGFTYLVNAMERIGKKWHWPKIKDEIIYEEVDVIKKINEDDIKPHTNKGTFTVKDIFILEQWGDQSLLKPVKTIYQKKDYVIVLYDRQFFPGVVTDIQDECGNFLYKVNALERFGKKWKWPAKRDEIFYQEKDVIKRINDSDIIPYSNRDLFIINDSFLAKKWNG